MEVGAHRKADILIVCSQSEVVLTLTYFLTVVLHHSAMVVEEEDLADWLQSKETRPKLVIYHTLSGDVSYRATLARLRHAPSRPFLLALTNDPRGDVAVDLFEAGADEVLGFPIPLKELAYRLKSHSKAIGLRFEFGALQSRKMEVAEKILKRIALTKLEAQVMQVLLANQGEIVTREDLSRAIDKTSWTYGDRKFDVHIGRIRKKLETVLPGELSVRTVHSAGYSLKLLHDE